MPPIIAVGDGIARVGSTTSCTGIRATWDGDVGDQVITGGTADRDRQLRLAG